MGLNINDSKLKTEHQGLICPHLEAIYEGGPETLNTFFIKLHISMLETNGYGKSQTHVL